ncbi:hypothetical protein COT52_00945 [candidate division WWE3 bacterium CG08_land_8_20_14_0_20_43_13]|uniref:PDZ domain-containing protein n=1 Tax=candidate division WWE3 bacterium CG08_land_8_20_14_0_20_43_13 TaxID=1975087 RepID=A0A2H0X7T8_UNCKA|nr:MAG: hypothetical protein COT52_00945 [candidate division WWE3 bacterium CG08_land_8_20_14_0_20_43_13]
MSYPNEHEQARGFITKIANWFLIALTFFAVGWYMGKRGYEPRLNLGGGAPLKIVNTTPPGKEAAPADFGLFWQVWDKVTSSYLFRPVEGKNLVDGAIKGMVAGVGDDYTVFLTAEEKAALDDSLSGRYQGIGIELAMKDNQLIVIAPLEGSPAKLAGVLAGDKILAVDGKPTVGLSITEAVSLIRGQSGTYVNLTLQYKDSASRQLNIPRGNIDVPSVTWDLKEDRIVYARISRFGADTPKEWQEFIAQLKRIGLVPKTMILDLRSNPGGYMQAAISLASTFIKKGVVVTEDRGGGITQDFKTSGEEPYFSGTKIIIIIDQGSASSSEILAVDLQYYLKAVLVGEKSFGKGTIQEALDLPEGTGLNITVARWLTPEGKCVTGEGLSPDYPVIREENEVSEGRDSQLEKAVELANSYNN